MATEEQTTYNTYMSIWGIRKNGQLLTISDRLVVKLAFALTKSGSPTGDVNFAIMRTSDDSEICSKVLGDAADVPTTYPPVVWQEVTFDAPSRIDEEVRIYAEFTGGDVNNAILVSHSSSDVKADEHRCFLTAAWAEATGHDCGYKYTYIAGEGGGVISVVEERLHYVDAYGQERFIQGNVVV